MGADDPFEEQIRARAYALYVERGFEDGHAEDDWLVAQQQLRQEQDIERGGHAGSAARSAANKRAADEDLLDQPTPIPGQLPPTRRGSPAARPGSPGRRARS